jgi:D-inositol-3-phosphate glycosyltransferase
MSAKRILLVSHYYPPHVGGIEIVAYNEATRLAQAGNQVTVVTSKVHGDTPSGLYEGVTVVRVPAFNGLEAKAIPFPIFSPSLFFRLWREVRKADVVHIHDVFYISSWSAAFVSWLFHRPTVVTQHVALVSHPGKLTTMIEKLVFLTTGKWTLRKCGAVITINGRVKRFLIDLGISERKMVEVSNGVDTELFHRPTKEEKGSAQKLFGLPARAFIVLFIGRFVPKKGFDLMLTASQDNYLTIFAGGETDLSPTSNQRFLGRVNQLQLAQLYQAADLFVLPSDSEGFPLTAQEAMASGVPVILKYDRGYARYKLTAEEVIFLKHPTVKTLRQAIVDLQHDLARRKAMAKQALRYVEAHFTWERHITNLDIVYTEVLERRAVVS